jgi:hypothetical protein
LGTATQYMPDVPFTELFSVTEGPIYANKTKKADHVLECLLSGFEKKPAKPDESHEHTDSAACLACRLFEASRAPEGDIDNIRLAAWYHVPL